MIGRFTTQDPLASDFASWTPYHYVHNNPIKFIDPTGMWADGYTIDKDGNSKWVNSEGGNYYDVIYAESEYNEENKKDYDDTGNKTGLQVSKGLIQSEEAVGGWRDLDGNTGEKDRFLVDNYATGELNDQEAQTVHQFLDEKTNVEWSVRYGENAEGHGIAVLGTSHKEGSVHSSMISEPYLFNNGYRRNHRADHNHPGNDPSASPADRESAKTTSSIFPGATFRILVDGKYYPYEPIK